jgi:2-succinyl-6-hydroxy-2,4-cyclohexadiene-1-carboxylate synthase
MSATSDATESPAVFTDRLVFLHGFTQTHHHWHHCAQLIADRLTSNPTLAFVDLPGHGLSGDDRTEINGCAQGLVELAGRGTYIGYSMGGRFALLAALEGGQQVERLVLIGATPGIEDASERVDRQQLDGRRAERLEQIGLDAFVHEWLAAPLFEHLPSDGHGLAHRRRNTVDGLTHSLRMCGTGRQRSLWRRLDQIRVPVLVIAGELDTKFTEIGHRMATALPDARFVAIAGAGHAAHSELPEPTADVIAGWLASS